MKRRMTMLVLAILMVLGLLPSAARAAETEPVLHGHFRAYQYLDYRTQIEEENSWYFYDAAGRVVREELFYSELTDAPRADAVEYTYYPDGTRKAARGYEKGKLLWTTSYDTHGNAYAKVDAARKPLAKYEVVYDNQGRLLKYVEAGPEKEYARFERHEYTYRQDGSWSHVRTVGDAMPNQEYIQFRDTYDYNAQGQLVRQMQDIDYGEAMLSLYIYSYNEQGEQNGKYNYYRGHGVTTGTISDTTYTRVRDSKGRTTQMTAKTVRYDSYDPKNVDTEETKTRYSYDREGRLVKQEEFLGGSSRKTPDIVTTWEYDSWGNLVLHTVNGEIKEENVYVPLKDALWKK